jgi:hypothetical protein
MMDVVATTVSRHNRMATQPRPGVFEVLGFVQSLTEKLPQTLRSDKIRGGCASVITTAYSDWWIMINRPIGCQRNASVFMPLSRGLRWPVNTVGKLARHQFSKGFDRGLGV